MTLSELPREIVNRIANLLCANDTVTCILVCKTWKKLFQDYVYSELEIDRNKLYNIVNSTKDDQQPYEKNRYLVKHLILDIYLRATDEEIYTLQKTFPNIKSLDFRIGSLRSDSTGIMADWNLWGLLREFRLSFGDLIMSDLENGLAKIIKCLPRLRQLKIYYFSDRAHQIPVSLNTLETLHSHLNHLGHLGLALNLSAFSKIDFERIPKVSPATEITTLDIDSTKTDYRWLYYFARKYPNLHTLRLDTEDTKKNSGKQRRDAIELFRKAPPSFQHLKSVDITHSDCLDEECLLFWNMIDFHDIPLKDIKVVLLSDGYLRRNQVYDAFKRIIVICLSKYSKTIESLVMRGSYEDITAFDFVEIKDKLCNLVKLEIELPTTGGIDTLLCAAPHLKSLSLDNSDLKIKNELYDSSRFGLESFKVDSSEITSDVLRYLSFHCRSLHTLTLTDTKVHGNFTEPGLQFIDMSYTHLQYLSFARVLFIINDNMRSFDNWNIALITDKLDDIPPRQDTDPKPLPVVIRDKSKKRWHFWFYSNYEKEMNYLSNARGSRIEKFVKDYEKNKKITIEKETHRGRGRRPSYWNRRFIFGYTKLKIGYIANGVIKEGMNIDNIDSFPW